jgi:E3 ubiquitin-protein ligase HUWE1
VLQDIEAVDPEYYKNLKWMLENDITDVLDLTFTAESDFFGKTEVVELVPGGRDSKVTEANKREYVNLIARHRMTTSIKPQIQVRHSSWAALVCLCCVNMEARLAWTSVA